MIKINVGIHSQIYADADGYSKNLKAWVDEAPGLGVVGLTHHGFCDASTLYKFRDVAHARGMQAGISFGLGDVGTHGAVTGRQMARLAKLVDYAGVDMEGKWEDDALDPQKAKEMLDAFRQEAPDVLLFDQPPSRPIPRHHGSLLWRIMAQWTQIRAPMWYWANLRFDGVRSDSVKGLGDDAYERICPDFEDDWNVWVPANTPKDVTPDPVYPTIQAYHQVPGSFEHFALRYPTFFLWSENHACTRDGERSIGPYPTAQTRDSMRIVAALRKAGFDGPTAVADFRNKRGLGPATMRKRADDKPSTVALIDAAMRRELGI